MLRSPLTPISSQSLPAVTKLDRPTTSGSDATPKFYVRGRAATLPSMTSSPLRPCLDSESQASKPAAVPSSQTLLHPVPTTSLSTSKTLPTLLRSHSVDDASLNIGLPQAKNLGKPLRIEEHPPKHKQTGSATSISQVSQPSKKRKHPDNDPKQSNSNKKKSKSQSSWTAFAVRHPDADRCISRFPANPSARTTPSDVARSAGPASAPPSVSSSPSFQSSSRADPHPAYPSRGQGLLYPVVQPAHGYNRAVGHQSVSSLQNGMQTVTRSNIPALHASYSAGAAVGTSPMRVAEGHRFVVNVASEVKLLLQRGRRYKLQTLTGPEVDEVLMLQEGASFSWIQVADPVTNKRWVLRFVEILSDATSTAGRYKPSSSSQVSQPACYLNAVAGPPCQMTPAVGPSALSSLPAPSSRPVGNMSVDQPMGFGGQSSMVPYQHQGLPSAPYAHDMQIPYEAIYNFAGSMSGDQGMSCTAPANFGMGASMGHPHHYLSSQTYPHTPQVLHTSAQMSVNAPVNGGVPHYQDDWGQAYAVMRADEDMSVNASANFDATEPWTHGYTPPLPVDALYMAEGNSAPVDTASLHMDSALMNEQIHLGSFPMPNEPSFLAGMDASLEAMMPAVAPYMCAEDMPVNASMEPSTGDECSSWAAYASAPQIPVNVPYIAGGSSTPVDTMLPHMHSTIIEQSYPTSFPMENDQIAVAAPSPATDSIMTQLLEDVEDEPVEDYMNSFVNYDG